MPVYVYRCPNKHTTEISHGMTAIVGVWCDTCGERMQRAPQKFSLSIPPSAPGMKSALEVHDHLKTKWKKNKERREINEQNQRKARETRAYPGAG